MSTDATVAAAAAERIDFIDRLTRHFYEPKAPFEFVECTAKKSTNELHTFRQYDVHLRVPCDCKDEDNKSHAYHQVRLIGEKQFVTEKAPLFLPEEAIVCAPYSISAEFWKHVNWIEIDYQYFHYHMFEVIQTRASCFCRLRHIIDMFITFLWEKERTFYPVSSISFAYTHAWVAHGHKWGSSDNLCITLAIEKCQAADVFFDEYEATRVRMRMPHLPTRMLVIGMGAFQRKIPPINADVPKFFPHLETIETEHHASIMNVAIVMDAFTKVRHFHWHDVLDTTNSLYSCMFLNAVIKNQNLESISVPSQRWNLYAPIWTLTRESNIFIQDRAAMRAFICGDYAQGTTAEIEHLRQQPIQTAFFANRFFERQTVHIIDQFLRSDKFVEYVRTKHPFLFR